MESESTIRSAGRVLSDRKPLQLKKEKSDMWHNERKEAVSKWRRQQCRQEGNRRTGKNEWRDKPTGKPHIPRMKTKLYERIKKAKEAKGEKKVLTSVNQE